MRPRGLCVPLLTGIAICGLLAFAEGVGAAGTVYLVLGSDTAIWDGMDVARFDCRYRLDLYTDPSGNASQVMSPAFRRRFLDSYGQPLKMTWWMMAGNIFRYARNQDVPVPGVMTMYLMRKYHGENVRINGDELSLHYHTFIWTDYDGDGRWWWNQARSFEECRDDFEVTLAQLLLEEEVFPVSFRSGWHYMDNDWQRYLNALLPFSLHNDYPSRGTDSVEPLDNILDWSRAPSSWLPYHPSDLDYQTPGQSPGWIVRSAHLSRAIRLNLLEEAFAEAARGTDQVACIWGHLPETDFLANIARVDSLLHELAGRYPQVRFRYCTAVEAMQNWLGTPDHVAPELELQVREVGDGLHVLISTDEPIFQPAPVLAFKDIHEEYGLVPCAQIGPRHWEALLHGRRVAKIGVSVCDSVGNQSLKVYRLLPDDLYCDDEAGSAQPRQGHWQVSSEAVWGRSALMARVGKADSAVLHWIPPLPQEAAYSVFVQLPGVTQPVRRTVFRMFDGGQIAWTKEFRQPPSPGTWIYLGTSVLRPRPDTYLEVVGFGDGAVGTLAVDVAKFSALVRDRDLHLETPVVDLGEVSVRDTLRFSVELANRGIMPVWIADIRSARGALRSAISPPLLVPAMGKVSVLILARWTIPGAALDTLIFVSDQPGVPRLSALVTARVQNYFVLLDNEDSLRYREFGEWHFSVAQAHGPTSRYALLGQIPPARALFTTELDVAGSYEVFQIVPATENATNHALYIVSIEGIPLDSVVVDQNAGSGSWTLVGRYDLPASRPVQVTIVDDGGNTNPRGVVLRADAVKFVLSEAGSSADSEGEVPLRASAGLFRVGPSYPNPCNGRARIPVWLERASEVQLDIYNARGERVSSATQGRLSPGQHFLLWDAGPLPSGVYLYRLRACGKTAAGKLLLVR
ncbi:MAG: hypothetical protein ONB23_10310 [candidate division KSB1 bacterium]|nr:hypothetical protein [candidate division KSB1 bacterium]